MGQETYVLVKVGLKKLPKNLLDELERTEEGGPFLVKNVALPAVLVWTPINYHALQSEDEEEIEMLVEEILDNVPRVLLKANLESRGVLLFADAGEPHEEWPEPATFEMLVEQAAPGGEAIPEFSKWVKISPDLLEEEVSKAASDDFLTELDEISILAIIDAKERRDMDSIRKILRSKLGSKYDFLKQAIEKWIQGL